MRRKTISVLAAAILVIVLVTSPVLLMTAAHLQTPDQSYVGFDSKLVPSPSISTYVDNSSLPNLLVRDLVTNSLYVGNITINGHVYVYPNDFNYSSNLHVELNPNTGNGFARNNCTIVFNVPGQPILMTWIVVKFSGLYVLPNGTTIAQNYTGYSTFKLTGTGITSQVDGFGIGEAYYIPPNYTQQFQHAFGYIKGWP
jgi:hypothetical protein